MMKNNLTAESSFLTARLPLSVKLLAALAAGALFAWSLAPHYLWVLGVISPMVLYALLLGVANARQAFWVGEAYGFGLWAVGAFWLFTSIHEYGGVPFAFALVMIAAMAAVMGLFHAAMSWAFVRFLGKQPLAFAGIWVLQEWLKTWLLTGFPWLFVGYALTDVAWLNGFAPITGVLGLSFLAVLFGAATIELFRYRGSFMGIAAALVATAAALSQANIAWVKPTGEVRSVSLVQGNIPQEIKWLTEFQLQTLQIYQDLSQSEWGRDVVIWPEAAIPLFADDAMPFISELAGQARAQGSSWVTGVPYREFDADDRLAMYNSVLAIDDEVSLYRKQRLVPFGEYIPFEGVLNILPNLSNMQGVQGFDAGSRDQAPLAVRGTNMGVAICYEVAYPETTRQNAQAADFLLTVSNDAWFGTSAGPWQHLQMVQMRSLEVGRYFVRATNNGVTAVIDERGRVLHSLPQFERAVLRADVPMMSGSTPYVRFGMLPILLLSVLLVALSGLAKRLGASKREQLHSITGTMD